MAKNVRSGDLGSGKGTFIVKEGSKEGKGAYSTKRYGNFKQISHDWIATSFKYNLLHFCH